MACHRAADAAHRVHHRSRGPSHDDEAGIPGVAGRSIGSDHAIGAGITAQRLAGPAVNAHRDRSGDRHALHERGGCRRSR